MPGPQGAPQQKTEVRSVTLFYPTENLRLGPEAVDLEAPEIETFAIREVANALLSGMNERWPGGFVPEGATVRAAYRIGDAAIIDVEAPPLTDGWTSGSQAEILTTQALVHSITWNFDGIERVQILVNGSEVPTFAGHVDLSKPLRPDEALTR